MSTYIPVYSKQHVTGIQVWESSSLKLEDKTVHTHSTSKTFFLPKPAIWICRYFCTARIKSGKLWTREKLENLSFASRSTTKQEQKWMVHHTLHWLQHFITHCEEMWYLKTNASSVKFWAYCLQEETDKCMLWKKSVLNANTYTSISRISDHQHHKHGLYNLRLSSNPTKQVHHWQRSTILFNLVLRWWLGEKNEQHKTAIRL